MKKSATMLLVFLMLLGLAACGREASYVSQLQKEYEPYAVTWQADAPKQARRRGEIHYYFMAGEGMIIDAEAQYPEKWGDSTLIVFPNGQTMLIDAGMAVYAPVLVENLHRLGVEKLDYLVITHPHNDHAGAALCEGGILDHFAVGQVYSSGLINLEWADPYLLENRCKEKNIPYQALGKGDVLTFGEVRMEVLHPAKETAGSTSTVTREINNLSLVLRFDYKEHSALFTGDIYVAQEKELVLEHAKTLDVDLLKMPHHGTEISNSQALAKVTSPEIAVAMGRRAVLRNNYYYYAAEGTRVLMDEHDGYIHVSADGQTMEYETSRKRVIDTELKEQYAALDQWAGLN